jgi:hypothetical protein
MFTGSEDVEEWLWKVGFLFKKYTNSKEELIEGLHYRLAGKAAQFLRVEGGCVGSFEDRKVIFIVAESGLAKTVQFADRTK